MPQTHSLALTLHRGDNSQYASLPSPSNLVLDILSFSSPSSPLSLCVLSMAYHDRVSEVRPLNLRILGSPQSVIRLLCRCGSATNIGPLTFVLCCLTPSPLLFVVPLYFSHWNSGECFFCLGWFKTVLLGPCFTLENVDSALFRADCPPHYPVQHPPCAHDFFPSTPIPQFLVRKYITSRDYSWWLLVFVYWKLLTLWLIVPIDIPKIDPYGLNCLQKKIIWLKWLLPYPKIDPPSEQ